MSSIKEKKIKGNANYINVDKLKEHIAILEKCVCKIITNVDSGTGFFCKLNIRQYQTIQRPFLMTNNHVINQANIDNQNFIKIVVNKKEKILNLDDRIKLTNIEKDFTIIEIKNYDNIWDFLEVAPDIFDGSYSDKITEKDIIIPQFPGGNDLSVAFGSITRMNEENLLYSASTDYGSSGSPVLLLDSLKIIGIHKERKFSNENCGTFIKVILEWIEEIKNARKINMLKELKGLKELKISNLELIKVIKNDESSFREIIILKDGRLCSTDNKSNINIYNRNSFQVEIGIKYSSLPDTYINLRNNEETSTYNNYYKIGCTNDNELFFYAKNSIFIFLILENEYKIIQQIPFEYFHCPNLYLYENKIILSECFRLKEFEKKGSKYVLINEFEPTHADDGTGTIYKEKFEFGDSFIEINNWTFRRYIEFHKIKKKDSLDSKNNNSFSKSKHNILEDKADKFDKDNKENKNEEDIENKDKNIDEQIDKNVIKNDKNFGGFGPFGLKIIDNDNEKEIFFRCPGTFHKNQKVLIEPSYLILGDSEILVNLDKYGYEIYGFIQKAAFKNDENLYLYNFEGKNFRICYENLSNSSFIYLNDNSFLSQIDIIKNENYFDLKLNEKREDIKGNYFLRNEDILFILSKNKISIYHF